jgi:hypothetical protein
MEGVGRQSKRFEKPAALLDKSSFAASHLAAGGLVPLFLLHLKQIPPQLLALQAGDRGAGVIVGRHLDLAEAFGLATDFVSADGDVRNFAEGLETAAKL